MVLRILLLKSSENTTKMGSLVKDVISLNEVNYTWTDDLPKMAMAL